MNNGMKIFYAQRGLVSSSHALASQTGIAVLREGGNALEAGVAVAAALAVLCPQRCGLGGDSVWLVAEANKAPFMIDGCGDSAAQLNPATYQALGHIPLHGAHSALCVAGAVSAWQTALHYSRYQWQGRMTLPRLFADAIYYAEKGFVITPQYQHDLAIQPEYLSTEQGLEHFFTVGKTPTLRTLLLQTRLAATLRYLSEAGLWSFYREALARSIVDDLHNSGSPLCFDDFYNHQASIIQPLTLSYHKGTLYTPPGQGLVLLTALALFMHWRPGLAAPGDSAYLHILCEAVKNALSPQVYKKSKETNIDTTTPLNQHNLHKRAISLNPQYVHAWPTRSPNIPHTGVWFAIMDKHGHTVSAMHSLGSIFGSGIVLPGSGICWNNSAANFTLEEHHPHTLAAKTQAPHSLLPLLAQFENGRCFAAAAEGGDTPQLLLLDRLLRVLEYGEDLHSALNAPRCLSLNNELLVNGIAPESVQELRRLGHNVRHNHDCSSHVGLVQRRNNGILSSATDGWSDGSSVGY
jgi:oxamate amidohydrolase